MKSAEMTLVRLDSADILTASGGGGWARVTGIGGSTQGDARVEGSLFGTSFNYAGADVRDYFLGLFGEEFMERFEEQNIPFDNGIGGMYLDNAFSDDYSQFYTSTDECFNGDYLWDDIRQLFRIQQ